MKTKRLPDTLHELLALALKDLRKAERSKKYKIDMGTWHTPNSHCSVCLAGSVIAFELGARTDEVIVPQFYDSNTANKLVALNFLREGRVALAVSALERVERSASSFDRLIASYPQRPKHAPRQRERFHIEMKELQKDLKTSNL